MSNSSGYDWDRDFNQNLADIVVRELEIEAASYGLPSLDQMIERMLTSPEQVGIAIVIDNRIDPDEEGLHVITERHFRLDQHVPFGRVYEFPSMDAYEIWHERGCPGPV